MNTRRGPVSSTSLEIDPVPEFHGFLEHGHVENRDHFTLHASTLLVSDVWNKMYQQKNENAHTHTYVRGTDSDVETIRAT